MKTSSVVLTCVAVGVLLLPAAAHAQLFQRQQPTAKRVLMPNLQYGLLNIRMGQGDRISTYEIGSPRINPRIAVRGRNNNVAIYVGDRAFRQRAFFRWRR